MMKAQRKVPEGWRWVRLRQVCEDNICTRDPGAEPDQPFTYIDISSIESSTKRIVNAKALLGQDAPSRARRVVHTGDVIVSTTRPNLNAVALITPDLDNQICSTGFCVLRPRAAVLDSEYLFALVQGSAFVRSLSRLVTGALYPAVTDGQVLAQFVPLPHLDEQKRIVAILNQKRAAIEQARAAAEAQLEAAQALRAAYLREVFSGPEAEKWPRVRVGEISSLVRDGPHVTPAYVPEGVPFLTVRNIVNRTIDLTDVSYISPEDHAVFSKSAKAERGDILYTKDGTLGVPCVVDRDLEFSFFVSVALIKPLRDRVDPYYLALALDSPDVLRQVDHLAAGAGLKHIVLRSIRALEIPLPPLDTQKRVAAELGGQLKIAEQAQEGIQERLDTVGRLPTAYLRQAFNGEL